MAGGVVSFREHESIVELRVRSNEGSSSSFVEVYKFGAHVTKWEESDKPAFLFLSSKAKLDASKAIRGGIPLIFPQFGPRGPLKQHGFARSLIWSVKDTSTTADSAEVTLALKTSPETREVWAHEFETTLTIRLKGAASSTLECIWTVKNPSSSTAFSFSNAFHTYFNVGDISKVSLSDLTGLKYIDNLSDGNTFAQEKAFIEFAEEVDRIYLQTADRLLVRDDSFGRTLAIQKSSTLPDAVAWNPWVQKSKFMSDFDDEEYKKMVCVEAGAIEPNVELQPNESFTQTMTLSCL